MLNHTKTPFHRGDTLIEVMFAVGVFGLASVGAISLMNRGLATAQNTLEVTMARQEIDGQAEVLRFLHNAYISSKEKVDTEDPCKDLVSYSALWKCLIQNYIYDKSDDIIKEDDKFYGREVTPGEDCNTLFHTTGNNTFSVPNKSFILNPRALGDINLGDQGIKLGNIIVTNAGKENNIRTTGTYPRLIYGDTDCSKESNQNKPECNTGLSDATTTKDGIASNSKTLQNAEGIWVTGVASQAGVECKADNEQGKVFRPDYYDFHIQTCWDSVAGNTPSTIKSTVRLFNPDQVSLASKQSVITPNPEDWEIHDINKKNGVNEKTTYEEGECPSCMGTSNCAANPGVYDVDHVKVDNNADGSFNVTFSGYADHGMEASAEYIIEGFNHFDVDHDIDVSSIIAHPGGTLTITLGPVSASVDVGYSHDGNPYTTRTIKAERGETKTINKDEFHLVLTKDGKQYSACVGTDCVSAEGDEEATSIKYQFIHGEHHCGCLSKVYLTGITMNNRDAVEDSSNGGCVRVDVTPDTSGDSIVDNPEDKPNPGDNNPDSGNDDNPDSGEKPEEDVKTCENNGYPTMQSWKDNLKIGESTTLCDARDNNAYKVTKQFNGVNLMNEDLRLNIDTANITAKNTNNPTKNFLNATKPASSIIQCSPYYDTKCRNTIGWYNNQKKYGANLYNWYTATAGNGIWELEGKGGKTTKGDICPTGWRLITKQQMQEFIYKVEDQARENGDVIEHSGDPFYWTEIQYDKYLIKEPYSFSRHTGHLHVNGEYSHLLNDEDIDGYYWTANPYEIDRGTGTSGEISRAFSFQIGTADVFEFTHLPKEDNYAVRCTKK